MSDAVFIEIGSGIRAESGAWYKNLQVLGTGGNAVTFLAMCTEGCFKGQLFAIKIFRRFSRPERKEAFLSEINFLKSCEHPGIMRIFDDGTYKGSPFLVAEYLPRTLWYLINRNISIVQKVSFAMQLISAIDHLSSLNPPAVHRDIKPSNIFVKGGSCVLGDFGMIKRLTGDSDEDRSIVRESTGPGMPFYYRTPDLIKYACQNGSLSPKSDVFQLGLVLTQLFTKRNPLIISEQFCDEIRLETIGRIPGHLGAGIATLLNRMLIIDQSQRENAQDFLDPFQAILLDAVQKSHESLTTGRAGGMRKAPKRGR